MIDQEYIVTSCCSLEPQKYIPVGYKDWSEANGVPMVPVMFLCPVCRNPVKFRPAKEAA